MRVNLQMARTRSAHMRSAQTQVSTCHNGGTHKCKQAQAYKRIAINAHERNAHRRSRNTGGATKCTITSAVHTHAQPKYF